VQPVDGARAQLPGLDVEGQDVAPRVVVEGHVAAAAWPERDGAPALLPDARVVADLPDGRVELGRRRADVGREHAAHVLEVEVVPGACGLAPRVEVGEEVPREVGVGLRDELAVDGDEDLAFKGPGEAHRRGRLVLDLADEELSASLLRGDHGQDRVVEVLLPTLGRRNARLCEDVDQVLLDVVGPVAAHHGGRNAGAGVALVEVPGRSDRIGRREGSDVGRVVDSVHQALP